MLTLWCHTYYHTLCCVFSAVLPINTNSLFMIACIIYSIVMWVHESYSRFIPHKLRSRRCMQTTSMGQSSELSLPQLAKTLYYMVCFPALRVGAWRVLSCLGWGQNTNRELSLPQLAKTLCYMVCFLHCAWAHEVSCLVWGGVGAERKSTLWNVLETRGLHKNLDSPFMHLQACLWTNITAWRPCHILTEQPGKCCVDAPL